MRSRYVAQTLVTVALTVGGCRFDAPSFDGTSYACEPPDETCPLGFTCMEGRCVMPEEGEDGDGDVDAAVAVDAPSADARPLSTTARRVEVAFDTTIRSDASTTNDGASQSLSIDASPRHVALVQLDVSSIELGAVLLGAELHVMVTDPIETGTYQIYPLTESWGETTATFEEREPGVPWSNGGLSVPTLDANTMLGEFAPRANGAAMVSLDTAQLDRWRAVPASNHGFAIVSTSPDGRGGQMRSREATVVTERPYVLVTIAAP